jgi:DNA-binding transcriptional ArsR family regulator
MVNLQSRHLDGIFAALSDPTRRAVLARLSEAPELSVTTLAAPFAMSLPAVLKHLDVLQGAGLILRRKRGRTVSCRLNAAPLEEAQRWLAHYERFWSGRLDALARYLAEEAAADTTADANPDATTSRTSNAEPVSCSPTPDPPPPPARNPASRSRASFRCRRTVASVRGPTRKP